MILVHHLVIAFFLVSFLPAFRDFLFTYLKLANHSPAANPVISANTDGFRAYADGVFKHRSKCGVGAYIYRSLLFSGNIAAFAFAVAIFDPAVALTNTETIYTYIIAYSFITVSLRAFVYALEADKLNFSVFLNNLAFSFTSLLLVMAGLGLAQKADSLEVADFFLFGMFQFAIFFSFYKLYCLDRSISFFERQTDIVVRMSLNLLLISFLGALSGLELQREYLFFAIALSFMLEMFMSVLGFEALRAATPLAKRLERFLVTAIAVALALKVLL